MALNLCYFNEFGKPVFQLINRFVEHWACSSKVGFCNTYARFLPRCMECRRGLAMRILSVCLSVCPSHTWIVTKR